METTQDCNAKETAQELTNEVGSRWHAVLKSPHPETGLFIVSGSNKADLAKRLEIVGLQNVETTIRGTEHPLKISF